ncbi:hypothetical protein GCM10022405_17160 [Gibbsiella dentisursi]|uniref:Uncharacterized protein n=1 Tax=Gibbsiella dentisursi TaxID=796890 RepID=A0ABP7L181_9GAMM
MTGVSEESQRTCGSKYEGYINTSMILPQFADKILCNDNAATQRAPSAARAVIAGPAKTCPAWRRNMINVD